MGITRAALLAGALAATACENEPAPPDDVVTVGDVYGVPADGGGGVDVVDVVTVGDVYGIPSDRGLDAGADPDAGSQPDVVTAGDVYGLPPG